MVEFVTPSGRVALEGASVVITRPASRVTVALSEIEDVTVGSAYLQVRVLGQVAANPVSAAHDPCVLLIAPGDAPAAESLRAAVLAARDKTGSDGAGQPSTAQPEDERAGADDIPHVTLEHRRATRASYGPATRERPDIKAAFHWFRHLAQLPNPDRWIVETVADDEMVLGAFDAWRNKDEGWQLVVVTDRRILRATERPSPALYEIPIGAVVGLYKGDTADGQVEARITDRTGYHRLWMRNVDAFSALFTAVTSARSRRTVSPPPAPEPPLGADIEAQYDKIAQLHRAVAEGTVQEDELGRRTAAVFGVTLREAD
ncbi:hypothetical protein [Tsukamurella soli]